MAGGAAHLRSHVIWEKVTVMDLLMEVLMMVMLDAEENLSVEVITVRSSVFTSTRKMTAVMSLPQLLLKDPHQSLYQEYL